jgi:hypothetical protein
MSRFDSPSLADVLLEATEDRVRRLHTAEPGEVLEYNATEQVVTVRPFIQRGVLDDDGAYVREDAPEVFDVPVMFPRTRAGYLTFPISQGDTGLIVYAMRDIGQWRYTGQRGSPGDHRVASMAGAIFIPGLYARKDKLSNVSNQHVVLSGLDGAEVRLGHPSPASYAALATKVDAELDRIWQVLTMWTVVAQDGGAALKAAAVAASPFVQSVAASKVKVE